MSLIPDYIKRKRGEAKVAYDHPLLEKVSADTFGVLIYQEQVMQAAQVLAGYTLGGADLLRRAMGKKDKAKMAKERETFIKGCAAVNGIPAAKANDIFDVLEKFAGYGFNRSHSAAYAWISYRTAYLKANYPVEFMAAVLSNEVNNTDKIGLFVNECRRMGIDVLGPDVNRSALGFRPESDTDRAGIRYGLAAVKNVGEAAMEAAVEERGRAGAFKSLEDFCRRLDPRKINRKVVESLVKAGAFDFTGEDRAALFARIESAIASAVSSQRDKAAGQASLFGGFDETVAPAPSVAEIAPWPEDEKLANEKALLGFYVTGHPLEPFAEILESAEYQKLAFMDEVEERAPVKVGGLFSSVDKKFSKKDGSPFAITVLEDLTGSIGVNIWTEAFEKFGRFVEVGKPVTILGKVDKREETPRIIASEIKPMRPPDRFSPVVLAFDRSSVTERDLVSLAELIRQYPGDRPLELEFRGPGDRRVRLKAGERYRVKMVPALRAHLERFLAP
jgi:DNA polymerase-3 subunit alpha